MDEVFGKPCFANEVIWNEIVQCNAKQPTWLEKRTWNPQSTRCDFWYSKTQNMNQATDFKPSVWPGQERKDT